MSTQRNRAVGNFFASSKNPGRYSTHVSHHSAHKQETTTLTPPMADSMHAVAGLIGLLAIAWAMGEDRRNVPWRAVGAGVVLELILALVFLKIPVVKSGFMALNDALLVLERATQAGPRPVFRCLCRGPSPFSITAPP